MMKITNNIDHGNSLVRRRLHEIGRSYLVNSIISSFHLVRQKNRAKADESERSSLTSPACCAPPPPCQPSSSGWSCWSKLLFTFVPPSPQISCCLNMRRGPLQTLPVSSHDIPPLHNSEYEFMIYYNVLHFLHRSNIRGQYRLNPNKS